MTFECRESKKKTKLKVNKAETSSFSRPTFSLAGKAFFDLVWWLGIEQGYCCCFLESSYFDWVQEMNEINKLLITYTMRTNLLNWCNLVSISKNVVFYASLVVRIYKKLADFVKITKYLVNLRTFTKYLVKFTKYQLV